MFFEDEISVKLRRAALNIGEQVSQLQYQSNEFLSEARRLQNTLQNRDFVLHRARLSEAPPGNLTEHGEMLIRNAEALTEALMRVNKAWEECVSRTRAGVDAVAASVAELKEDIE